MGLGDRRRGLLIAATHRSTLEYGFVFGGLCPGIFSSEPAKGDIPDEHDHRRRERYPKYRMLTVNAGERIEH